MWPRRPRTRAGRAPRRSRRSRRARPRARCCSRARRGADVREPAAEADRQTDRRTRPRVRRSGSTVTSDSARSRTRNATSASQRTRPAGCERADGVRADRIAIDVHVRADVNRDRRRVGVVGEVHAVVRLAARVAGRRRRDRARHAVARGEHEVRRDERAAQSVTCVGSSSSDVATATTPCCSWFTTARENSMGGAVLACTQPDASSALAAERMRPALASRARAPRSELGRSACRPTSWCILFRPRPRAFSRRTTGSFILPRVWRLCECSVRDRARACPRACAYDAGVRFRSYTARLSVRRSRQCTSGVDVGRMPSSCAFASTPRSSAQLVR